MTIRVYHVDANHTYSLPGNQQADELARIHLLKEVPMEDMAVWLHTKSGRRGQ